MGIFTRGINKAAYRGSLNCPACRSKAIRFVENIGPMMQRYRCRKCGLPFLYDIGPSAKLSGNLNRPETHPYARLGDKFVRQMKVPIIGTGHGRTNKKENEK